MDLMSLVLLDPLSVSSAWRYNQRPTLTLGVRNARRIQQNKVHEFNELDFVGPHTRHTMPVTAHTAHHACHRTHRTHGTPCLCAVTGMVCPVAVCAVTGMVCRVGGVCGDRHGVPCVRSNKIMFIKFMNLILLDPPSVSSAWRYNQ